MDRYGNIPPGRQPPGQTAAPSRPAVPGLPVWASPWGYGWGFSPGAGADPLFPDFARQTGIPPRFRDMPAEGLPGVPAPSEGQGFPLPLVNLPPSADRNAQSQYAAGPVSGVSGASAPGRAGQYFTDAEIRDLYCPYNPVEKDFIVLGICTKGGTSPGDDLPDLYDAAGVEMRCHSCGNPLTGDSLYRDHQPPTNLRKQFFLFQSYNGNPPGETGKIRQILDYVCTHPLPLYEFECIIIKDGGAKRLRCQTNHLETARKLALGPIRTVNYGENFKHQYLYPHCCACSNTQGKKLW